MSTATVNRPLLLPSSPLAVCGGRVMGWFYSARLGLAFLGHAKPQEPTHPWFSRQSGLEIAAVWNGLDLPERASFNRCPGLSFRFGSRVYGEEQTSSGPLFPIHGDEWGWVPVDGPHGKPAAPACQIDKLGNPFEHDQGGGAPCFCGECGREVPDGRDFCDDACIDAYDRWRAGGMEAEE